MSGRTPGTVTPQNLHQYVRGQIDRVRTSVQTVLQPGHPRPETLHDLHRDLRRLRVIIAWRQKVVPPRPPTDLEELSGRLRRLTRLVGRVRDLDVELALWRTYRPGPRRTDPGPRRALATFGHRLQDDSRTGRELLRATLLADVNAGLLERLESSLSRTTTPAAAKTLARAIEKERRRLAERAARLRRRALRDPDADRLHEFRVLIRRLRYLSDLEDRLEGRPGSTFPARYAGALRRLGELHDRDVLAAHLDSVDPTHREELWSLRFRAEHRQLRKDLLKELKELHPRRHLGRTRADNP